MQIIIRKILLTLIITSFLGTASASVIPWESNYGTLSDLSDDDDNSELFTFGFNFNFYNTTYTQAYGSSNGAIFFDDEDDYEIGSDIEDEYGPMIAAFNGDLNPDEDGDIYTNTLGAPGNKRFVITWLNVIDYEEVFYNTFQAILYENGEIRLNYLQLNGSDDGSGDDVIGVSQGDGSHFNYFTAADGNANGIYPTGQSLLYSWNASSANYDLSVDTLSVPEPSSLAIFALGIMGLTARRFKK